MTPYRRRLELARLAASDGARTRALARIESAFGEQRLSGMVLTDPRAHAVDRFHAAEAQRWAWHQIEDARLALRGLEA